MSWPPITRWDGVLFQRQLKAALDALDAGGGGISDGDKGDITVSGSGTVWTVDAAVLSGKQDTLVSGTNIKTVNGTTLLGSGDLVVSGGGGASAASVWVL